MAINNNGVSAKKMKELSKGIMRANGKLTVTTPKGVKAPPALDFSMPLVAMYSSADMEGKLKFQAFMEGLKQRIKLDGKKSDYTITITLDSFDELLDAMNAPTPEEMWGEETKDKSHSTGSGNFESGKQRRKRT
jgi:outer membrane protein assembly factor BamB